MADVNPISRTTPIVNYLAFRACIASNSTGGRYPRLECNRFLL